MDRVAISNAMVRIMLEHTGRGPTRSRTLVLPDVILVVLRDCLTQSERQLVDEGRTEVVLGMRQAYQDSMRAEMIAVVEETTGLVVETFLSTTSVRPDITVDVFIMHDDRCRMPRRGRG